MSISTDTSERRGALALAVCALAAAVPAAIAGDIPKPARDLPRNVETRVLPPDEAGALFREDIQNVKSVDADKLIHEVLTRFEKQIAAMQDEPAPKGRGFPLPPREGWWWRQAGVPLSRENSPMMETLEGLYVRALDNSAQIRVFADLPRIRETGIREAGGAFDTELFASLNYHNTDEPVGSTLTTGGPSRFLEEGLTFEAGVRKKIITGAEIKLGQELKWLDNNSKYLVPNPQALARLSLTLTQPLLKFGGVNYNRSIIEIAKLDAKMALSEFLRQTESHLLEVNRAYWSLYLSRALLLEKKRLSEETEKVASDLEARSDLDLLASQRLVARAAAAERAASLVRAELAVRNAESRIKALVNDPAFYQSSFQEIVPADDPRLTAPVPGLRETVLEALRNRPEIAQALYQLRSTIIRLKMQRNELLPELNLVLRGSVGGLSSGRDWDPAYSRQFDTGSPSYGGGLIFTYPLEGNFAKARMERRRLEVRQQIAQLEATIETVLLEVRVALRELATAQREMAAKYAAAEAATAELSDLYKRKELDADLGSSSSGSGGGDVAGYLDRLLDSQERNAAAREAFLQSLSIMNVAIANLERAKGTLLRYENITVERQKDENYDQLAILKLLKDLRAGNRGDAKSVKPVRSGK